MMLAPTRLPWLAYPRSHSSLHWVLSEVPMPLAQCSSFLPAAHMVLKPRLARCCLTDRASKA